MGLRGLWQKLPTYRWFSFLSLLVWVPEPQQTPFLKLKLLDLILSLAIFLLKDELSVSYSHAFHKIKDFLVLSQVLLTFFSQYWSVLFLY